MPAKEPAPIRYKNPGAMWGHKGTHQPGGTIVRTNAPIPLRWGSKETMYLGDGLKQGNNIAIFPTYVQGICAQLDLWRSSALYRNKRFADAIAIWSGGNHVEDYIAFVLKRVPGMTRNTVMSDSFFTSSKGVDFLKAQAWHESGQKYPAPDSDFIEAQRRTFEGMVAPAKPAPQPAPPPPAPPPPEPPAKGEPQPDDTQPHAAEPTAAKTGITEGAKVGIGAGAIGLGTQAWDTVSQAPDTLLQAFVDAMRKPAFWVFAIVICAAAYVWWRRKNMKAA